MKPLRWSPRNFDTGMVYRCFDAAGRLLYIGCTSDLRSRIWQHKANTPWWSDVAEVVSEPYEFRHQALAAERAAIVAEQPLHNARRHFTDLPEASEVERLLVPAEVEPDAKAAI